MSKINHFIIHYKGNKRNETIQIINHIDFNSKKSIVEPFAGTSAMSFKIYQIHKNKFNYYINDIDDKLIQLYNLLKTTPISTIEENVNRVRNEILSKTISHKTIYTSNRDIYDYIFVNKYCMYGIPSIPYIDTEKYQNTKRLLKPYKISPLQEEFINFIKSPNVFITNNDFQILYEEHKNNPQSIILLDPPYINTDKSFYKSTDNSIYTYFANNLISNNKASTYVIVDDNWIMRIVFKDCNILFLYDKKYEIVHRKVSHIIFSNNSIE